jgi:hypothetical protein
MQGRHTAAAVLQASIGCARVPQQMVVRQLGLLDGGSGAAAEPLTTAFRILTGLADTSNTQLDCLPSQLHAPARFACQLPSNRRMLRLLRQACRRASVFKLLSIQLHRLRIVTCKLLR